MTVMTSSTDAPTHVSEDWHAINWRKVHQNVRRLQTRLVKATQAKKWRKVQALQRLLTRSFSGKALAVRRVTENQGKRTPGIDDVTWSTPASKSRAIRTLRQHGYRAQPLRRVYIPKKNGKFRSLGIPTMKDRAMQALYKLALEPLTETTGDPNSYGFRPGRSPADAIEQCFNLLGQKRSATWILEGDIQSCFDQISHVWLETHIPLEKRLLQQWLQAGYMEQGAWWPTQQAGTPQGGIISPLLANMALDGLETLLHQHFPPRKGLKVHLVRFADDFIITAHDKALLENEIKSLVEDFLGERGLQFSPTKSHVTHIETGFDFLGQTIRKFNGKLLIQPAKTSQRAFLKEIRTLIRTHPQVTAGELIAVLNPVIRGWANYHRHVVSKRIFVSLERQIFQALWRWARRRHPRKSTVWLHQKYFPAYGRRQWHFSGHIRSNHQGKMQPIRLVPLAHIPIQRHIKVRAQANPFDPQWETYFEARLDAKMLADLAGKQALRTLWLAQKGLCPVCGQKITQETGWHSHHRVWRVHGGSDGPSNRVLLHPNCHQQVHTHGLFVGKPRPACQGV